MLHSLNLFFLFKLDFEENQAPILPKGHDYKVKKSLNFDDEASHSSRPNSSLSGQTALPDDAGRKRLQDEVFGSLSDDDDLCGKSRNTPCYLRNKLMLFI